MPASVAPKISVLLPVYNAEPYLAETIDSVLAQTFSDFELIIINDGSTDRSADIIRSYSDKRIRFIEQQNMGLSATLNKGIALARGEYIARQDNDDISLPERFRKQADYLDAHPSAMLLGTSAEIIDDKGCRTGRTLDHQKSSVGLKYNLLFNNPFVHSSVMFRKAVIVSAGDYRVNNDFFEDYDLWSRIARVGDVANLKERLLLYREVQSSMSRTTSDYMQRVINQSISNILYYCPGLPKQKVGECVSYISGTAECRDFKVALRLIKEVLHQLNVAFALKESVPLPLVKRESNKQVLSFKRHYYNSILLSRNAGPALKLKARIGRKLIFIRQGIGF
jgi:glycosyltransferase involved in cell wall biosynthesis